MISSWFVSKAYRRRAPTNRLPVLHWSFQPRIPHQAVVLVAARAKTTPRPLYDRLASHSVTCWQCHDRRVESTGPAQRRTVHSERHHRHHGDQISSAHWPARSRAHLDHQPGESQRASGTAIIVTDIAITLKRLQRPKCKNYKITEHGCVHVDYQSYWYCYGEETGKTASPCQGPEQSGPV